MSQQGLTVFRHWVSRIARARSVRARLMALQGTTMLAALLLTVISVVYFTYRIEAAAWRGRQEEAARAAAGTVAAFVQRIEDVLVMADTLGSDGLVARPEVMTDAMRRHPVLKEVVYLDAAGHVLAAAQADRPVLADLFTIPQSQWFQQARGGQPSQSGVEVDRRGTPYLVLALPATAGNVIAGRLDISLLWNVVADIRFGKTGQVYVVNYAGQIIAHPDPQVVLAHTEIGERPEFRAWLAAPDHVWYGEYANTAGRVVGATAAVAGTDWLVVVEISRGEVYAASQRALALLGGGMLLMTALISLLTRRLLIPLVLRPMEQLRAGAERIGRGDLAHRIGLTDGSEIGQVARAFDEMASHLEAREQQLTTQTAALAAEVAERQRTEESLRQLNEQLENRVQERTAELEKRNEELDAFAHTVAHDLKSPLTQVRGYAEMLMEIDDALSTEEHRQALESIVRGSARMNNIIDELLLLASVHKAEVPRTPLDMASVVSAAQERVAYLTEELGAELILPTVWPTALGYGPWVEEVWVNYLSNALKYGGRPPHLELGAEVVPEAETKDCDGETLRKQVRFWVRDNGPGLTPEEQKELFAPFARLAQARTSGYGLGLSIVRRIVEKLGGQVSVMSTPGEGSLFSFTLPAV